jgi:hypothetical protein
VIYLDTSVVVALLTAEARSDDVARWFERLAEPVVGSDWVLTEFASALSIKRRSGQIPASMARAARREIELLVDAGLRLAPVDRPVFRDAAVLVDESKDGLRAGDALHLAAARRAGARAVATLDRRMAAAARRIGFGVEPDGDL